MNGKTLSVVIVIIVIVGGWYLLKGTPASAPATTTTETPVTTTTSTTTATTSVVTINYGDEFSPKTVAVPVGTTVEFVDRSPEKDMWIASDPHPTHQGYDGTTKSQHCVAGYSGPIPFDQCSVGTSYSFIFTKAGTWGYHNHGSAADKGTIIVTAAQ